MPISYRAIWGRRWYTIYVHTHNNHNNTNDGNHNSNNNINNKDTATDKLLFVYQYDSY